MSKFVYARRARYIRESTSTTNGNLEAVAHSKLLKWLDELGSKGEEVIHFIEYSEGYQVGDEYWIDADVFTKERLPE
jgi:hypothetical protein